MPAPEVKSAPAVESRPAPPVQPEPKVHEPKVPEPVMPEPVATAVEPAPPRPATDPRLSDMARRLQSVLQRPMTPPARPAGVDANAAAAAETKPIPLPSARKPDIAAEPEVAIKPPKAPKAPAPAAEQPVTQGKELPVSPIASDPLAIDSLEEEMARLLGRPGPGKS